MQLLADLEHELFLKEGEIRSLKRENLKLRQQLEECKSKEQTFDPIELLEEEEPEIPLDFKPFYI